MVQLHHVALGAEDVRLVADFYARAFDLLVVKEHHYEGGRLRSIWLRAGDTILMVERIEADTIEAPPRAAQSIKNGAFLLAFAVTSSEKDAAEKKLISLGAVIESRSKYSIYARDPEGNRVALSHFPFD